MSNSQMVIYPEIKQIAGAAAKISRLVSSIADKLDVEGIDWRHAKLLDGLSEHDGHLWDGDCQLDNGNGAPSYYCNQSTGYCEDCYYGELFFRTNVPGQWVRVYFEM